MKFKKAIVPVMIALMAEGSLLPAAFADTASTSVSQSTQAAVYGSTPVTNTSIGTTYFEAALKAGQSYEVINQDMTSLHTLTFKGWNAVYQVVVYDSQGKVRKTNISEDINYIDIPAGGRAIFKPYNDVVVKGPIADYTNKLTISTINQDPVLAEQTPKGTSYTLTNNQGSDLAVNIHKTNFYTATKNVVIYDKNGVITNEFTNDIFTSSFVIPEHGSAVFTPGNDGISVYVPNSSSDFFGFQRDAEENTRNTKCDMQIDDSPYIISKNIKVTNTGSDNWFMLQASTNLKFLDNDQTSKKLYLKAGQSVDVAVTPASVYKNAFSGSVSISQTKAGYTYSTLPSITSLSIPFSPLPYKIGQKPEISTAVITNTSDVREQSMTIKMGDSVTTITSTLTKIPHSLAPLSSPPTNLYGHVVFKYGDSPYSNGGTLKITPTDDGAEVDSEQSTTPAAVDYKGYANLSADDMTNCNYELSSNIHIEDNTMHGITKPLIGKVITEEYGILAPYATSLIDQFNQAGVEDKLNLMSSDGEISPKAVTDYNTRMIAQSISKNVLNSGTQGVEVLGVMAAAKSALNTLGMSRVGANAASVAADTDTIMGGIGAIYLVETEITNWAIGEVNDTWDQGVEFWIQHDAEEVAKGTYPSTTYIDAYGHKHLMTKTTNTVIS